MCLNDWIHEPHDGQQLDWLYPKVDFWFDRYRGKFDRDHHVFVVYDDPAGILRWWCEVPQYVSSPEALFDRIADRERSSGGEVGSLRAGGKMCEAFIDFTLLQTPVAHLKPLVAHSFSADQTDSRICRYENATVLVRSEDFGWGTVGEIVKLAGYSLAH